MPPLRARILRALGYSAVGWIVLAVLRTSLRVAVIPRSPGAAAAVLGQVLLASLPWLLAAPAIVAVASRLGWQRGTRVRTAGVHLLILPALSVVDAAWGWLVLPLVGYPMTLPPAVFYLVRLDQVVFLYLCLVGIGVAVRHQRRLEASGDPRRVAGVAYPPRPAACARAPAPSPLPLQYPQRRERAGPPRSGRRALDARQPARAAGPLARRRLGAGDPAARGAGAARAVCPDPAYEVRGLAHDRGGCRRRRARRARAAAGAPAAGGERDPARHRAPRPDRDGSRSEPARPAHDSCSRSRTTASVSQVCPGARASVSATRMLGCGSSTATMRV